MLSKIITILEPLLKYTYYIVYHQDPKPKKNLHYYTLDYNTKNPITISTLHQKKVIIKKIQIGLYYTNWTLYYNKKNGRA